MLPDIYGTFLKDYYHNKLVGEVLLNNNYGEAEELPVETFYRLEDEMPDVEVFAMNFCKGTVLDIGAGTGNHCLVLQSKGFDVTAIELSPGACEVMQLRGVKKIINEDVMLYKKQKFDTLLMMMNGIGFCGYIDDLKLFLIHAKDLINKGGQILFDSSDVAYLYEGEEIDHSSYYGEIDYQYDYNNEVGEWFSWLYIDEHTLRKVAKECGWELQVIHQDLEDHYLGRLTLV